jgi:hypothetical protein
MTLRTLILNQNWRPLSTVNLKRGIKLQLGNPLISTLESYDLVFRSEREEFFAPAVLLYNKFVKMPDRKMPTKRLVLSRDKYICQYCGIQMQESNATIDHVIAASTFDRKVDANTWGNMVACCNSCNGKKGDLTLAQCGMKLKRTPKEYKSVTRVVNPPAEWEKYL